MLKLTRLALCFLFASQVSAQTIHDVTVAPGGDDEFSPSQITIDVGDCVRWTWADDGHNVVSGVPGAATALFSSGSPEDEGFVFEFCFDAAFVAANPVPGGVYEYICEPHQFSGMVGSVVVVDTGPTFSRGDCNDDGGLDVADPVVALAALFSGGSTTCFSACDANDDGGFDISDAVYLLSNLFSAGPAIPAPTTCGTDPTSDTLDCGLFMSCP